MGRFFKRLILAFLLAIPFFLVAHMGALISTPLWWKVEAWTGWELAGRHGPNDVILIGFWMIGVVAAFGLVFRPRQVPKGSDIMPMNHP